MPLHLSMAPPKLPSLRVLKTEQPSPLIETLTAKSNIPPEQLASLNSVAAHPEQKARQNRINHSGDYVDPWDNELSFARRKYASTRSTSNSPDGAASISAKLLIRKPRPYIAISSPRVHTLLSMKPFLAAVGEPPVLAACIAHLEWLDVYALLCTTSGCRHLFDQPELHDVFLSRFVPGYAKCLRLATTETHRPFQLTIQDLDLLLISERVPLHRYPTHALKVLTGLYPSLEDDKLTQRLASLTNAHSRCVLLLQALAHSSTASLSSESEESVIRLHSSNTGVLRQITFPPPLSYCSTNQSKTVPLNKNKALPTISQSCVDGNDCKSDISAIIFSPTKQSPADKSLSTMVRQQPAKKVRRLSIFGSKSYDNHIPPPREEPRALKMYSSTWRRNSNSIDLDIYGDRMRHLKRPHRRFIEENTSSDSSLSGPIWSHGSGCGSPCPSLSRTSLPSPVQRTRVSTPHDLVLAASRVRAPILRVFIPCTRLDSESESLVMCRQQLEEAGLWEHIVKGDVVCNLGYVPPAADENSREIGESVSPLKPPTFGYWTRGGNVEQNEDNERRKWLLYDGRQLVPYAAPDILPLTSPLTLPSPFYYAHVLPPFSSPSYVLHQLPALRTTEGEITLALVKVTVRVPSTHTPGGYLAVRKHAWTARVLRVPPTNDAFRDQDEENKGKDKSKSKENLTYKDIMGIGWYGEWVLEGDGTHEGQQFLLDALKGYPIGRHVWEIVREKSGGGRAGGYLIAVTDTQAE